MYITLAFFLVSGIFFELFTATSQQQHIANKTAESSADFQSIQNTEIVIKPDASSAAELAKAERRLTQCKVKLARREVPHCDGDATAVSSLQRSQQASNSSIGGAVDKAITAKTDSMLKITEEKNKPLFKMIRDEFNVTINTGMIIAVAIMIFIFEVTHITNLFVYAGRIRRFRQLEAGLDDMRGQYHQLTGNDYTPPAPPEKTTLTGLFRDFRSASPFAPASRAVASSFAGAANNINQSVPGILANELGKAQQAREQVIADTAQKLDSIAEAHAGRSQDKTYRQELNEGQKMHSDSPLDKPRPTPLHPQGQHKGGTGLHNPALGKCEAIYPLPLTDTNADRPSLTGQWNPVNEPLPADRPSLTGQWNPVNEPLFADRSALTGQQQSVNEPLSADRSTTIGQ